MSHRVLLLIKGLGRGGAEQLLVNSAAYMDMAKFRYEVAYVLPEKSAFADSLRDSGMFVHCLGRGVNWLGELKRLVARRRIDLIHAHSPIVATGARLIFPRRSAMSIVYTEHGPWHHYRRRTYLPNMLTFGRNDHVFTVSEYVRLSIKYPLPMRTFPMPSPETLYHGLDTEAVERWGMGDGVRAELGIKHDAPVVVTVANFRPQKRHEFLLEVAAIVRRRLPEIIFVLVGQGPLEKQVRDRVERMGLDGTVVFAGFRDDVPRLLSAFDVFALPSGWEGLSIALLEAMALGLPAVASQAGGVSEVIEDGRNGVLVPQGDHERFADEIIRLIEDRALATSFGKEARVRARRFDIKSAVKREEDVYAELLA